MQAAIDDLLSDNEAKFSEVAEAKVSMDAERESLMAKIA